jgi:hypothetical protein
MAFICSTGSAIAATYGSNVYRVYPKGDPVVGICPESDFWASFKGVKETLASSRIVWLNNWFRGIASELKLQGVKITTYPALMDYLDKNWNTKEIRQLFISQDFFDKDRMAGQLPVDEEKVLNSFKSCTDMLDHFYDPVRNGFKLAKLSNLEKHVSSDIGNEVWFCGEALFKHREA